MSAAPVVTGFSGGVGAAVATAASYFPALSTLVGGLSFGGASSQPIKRLIVDFDPVASVAAFALAGTAQKYETPGKLVKNGGRFVYEINNPKARRDNGDSRNDLLYFTDAFRYVQFLYPLSGVKKEKADKITMFWNLVKTGITVIESSYAFEPGNPFLKHFNEWRDGIDLFLTTSPSSSPAAASNTKTYLANEMQLNAMKQASQTAFESLETTIDTLKSLKKAEESRAALEGALSNIAELHKQIDAIGKTPHASEAERLTSKLREIWKGNFYECIDLLVAIDTAKKAKSPIAEAELNELLQGRSLNYSKFAKTLALDTYFPYKRREHVDEE